MSCEYILDNTIILDYLLNRIEINPKVYYLFKKLNKICISSSQIHNLKYIFFVQRKKIIGLDNTKKEWEEFIKRIEIVKTPSYFEMNNKLFKTDLEDYLIELSANQLGLM